VRLIKETIDKIGRRHIELIAVMAEYNPFATHAGMKLIARTEPHPSVLRAIESLEPLGFQKQFMASHSFNLDRLTQLSSDEVEEIRRILLRVKRMYYKRIGSSGRPYPTRTDMNEWLETQPLERLAKCLQNLAILGQGKVYLYWSRTHEQDGEAV
jgi:hypothetical protein